MSLKGPPNTSCIQTLAQNKEPLHMRFPNSNSLLISLVLLVAILWVISWLLLTTLIPTPSERGQFGDMFGSVNALFSGLAFAGLIFTIHLQREELAMQREELRLQREEMRLQREEMQASREQLTNQAHAQLALVRATVGQMRVAALQAEIEAIKMEAEQYVPHARKKYMDGIRVVVSKMDTLAQEIEHEC